MMILVGGEKGGSGKTTIAINLAHCHMLDGYKVLLVDSDPQGSARDWNEENEGCILPVVGLDRETLPKDLAAIGSGYDWIVIDGAPQIAKLARMSKPGTKIMTSNFFMVKVKRLYSAFNTGASSSLHLKFKSDNLNSTRTSKY